jgi:hypothetical protein
MSTVMSARDLAKREWLLEAMERQRALSPKASSLEEVAGLSGEHFFETYYAPCRPVILKGEMTSWPATRHWTPGYLKTVVGSREVEFQAGRARSPSYERQKDAHKTRAPFNAFIDQITAPGSGNDAYLTAYNSAANTLALGALHADLGLLDKFLTPERGRGMLWIGPEGTFTPLHHDLTNNFIAQIIGRKRVVICPASEVGHLYNDAHVFSEILDLETGLDGARFPRLNGVRVYSIELKPGDILFLPFGWWHQLRALDFSVTATFTNFRWPNEAYKTYPGE